MRVNDYFVIIRGSGSKKTGTATLRNVVQVSRVSNFVVFYADGGRNPVLVPLNWLLDYGPIHGPIEDEEATSPPDLPEGERVCRKLDGIIQALDPSWKGGDTVGQSIKHDRVHGHDVGPMCTAGVSRGANDAS